MTKELKNHSTNQVANDAVIRELVRCSSKLFVKKGYERATVKEIAQAFGRSKGGLYHYVNSKKEIRDLVINYAISMVKKYLPEIEEAAANNDITAALCKSIEIYFKKIVDEHQDMQIFLHHVVTVLQPKERQVMYDNVSRVVDCFEKLILRGNRTGEFEVDDPKLVAHDIVLLGQAWADRRWYLKKLYTLQEYTEKQTNHILNRVKSGRGLPVTHSSENKE